MPSKEVIEAMLLRWGENHASGRTVTFLLPDEPGPHPFKGLKCGPEHGQRLALSIVLINDDETTSEAKAAKKTRNSQVAALLCSDSGFALFLRDTHSASLQQVDRGKDGKPCFMEAQVAHAVRDICKVKSRSEFDSDPEAAKRWHALKGDYENWKRGMG